MLPGGLLPRGSCHRRPIDAVVVAAAATAAAAVAAATAAAAVGLDFHSH